MGTELARSPTENPNALKNMKAIVLNIQGMFGRRYKSVILADDNDDLEEICKKFPYSEVESVDYVDFVMDKNYKRIKS